VVRHNVAAGGAAGEVVIGEIGRRPKAAARQALGSGLVELKARCIGRPLHTEAKTPISALCPHRFRPGRVT